MVKYIAILIILTTSVVVKADDHISLWLCHNAKNEIVSFNNKHFNLQFVKNKVVSFMTQDSLVNYDIKNESFAFKSPLGDEIKLFYQNKILIAQYKDTSIDIENYLKFNFNARVSKNDGQFHDTILIGGLALVIRTYAEYKKDRITHFLVNNLSITFSNNTTLSIGFSSNTIAHVNCQINDSTYATFHNYYWRYKLFVIAIYDNYKMKSSQTTSNVSINGVSVSMYFRRNEKLYDIKQMFYKSIDLPKRVRWDENRDFYQLYYPVSYFRYNYRGKMKTRNTYGKVNYCESATD